MDFENKKLKIFLPLGRDSQNLLELGDEEARTMSDLSKLLALTVRESGYEGLVNIYSSPEFRAVKSSEIVLVGVNSTEGLEGHLKVDPKLGMGAIGLMETSIMEDYNVGIFVSDSYDISRVVGMDISPYDCVVAREKRL